MQARELVNDVAALIEPREKVSPSESAARYLRNEKGRWSLDLTPMFREPLDAVGSREYQGIVFVGPARTGKTFSLIDGAICYAATIEHADTMLVAMTQDHARDTSRTEIDRIIRHSPALKARLSPRPRDNATHDKVWRSGATLKIAWPTISNLASRTIRFMLLTDYDRPLNRDNVDGEGPLWDLALKRTTTYLSRGCTIAESSPGEDYADEWQATSASEAPPARGILSLFNQGTRARWFWPCLHCGEPFEAAPGLDVFRVPPIDELRHVVLTEDLHQLAIHYARIACPHCGALHQQADRADLNAGGRWLHAGERFEGDEIVGERRQTPIASYWLGGCAAVFSSWLAVIERYLQAVKTFAQLGDEGQLKAVTNLDLGMPYRPQATMRRQSSAKLRERIEALPRGTVPDEARFLTRAVDVQARSFVVQTHAWGPHLESWIIDRYSITGVDPAALIEDWLRLLDDLDRDYPLRSDPDVRVPVRLTLVDSGGAEGTTNRAYEFMRRARRAGKSRRIRLVKGTGYANAPRTKVVFPDSTGRVDRDGGKGDVPVILLNVNLLKDAVSNDLARAEPGPGFVHLPHWLEDDFFDELVAETRTAKGWQRTGARNEAFDLAVYNRAACVVLKAERINWNAPPSWARSLKPEPKPEPEPDTKPVRQAFPADLDKRHRRKGWASTW